MTDIDATLAERGARYGDFATHAVIAMAIKGCMTHAAEGWTRLDPAHQQALHVIADKIARILNGDPNYADNWHDIAGYATLVERIVSQNSPEVAEAKSVDARCKDVVIDYFARLLSDAKTTAADSVDIPISNMRLLLNTAIAYKVTKEKLEALLAISRASQSNEAKKNSL